jgi:hypothetical protein
MKGLSTAAVVAMLLIVVVVAIVAVAWVYTATLSITTPVTTVTYDGAFDVVGLAKASLAAPFGGDFAIINPATMSTTSISGGNATLQVANGTSINSGTTFNLDFYFDITDPVSNLDFNYYTNYNETVAGTSGNFTSTQIGLDSAALYRYDAGSLTSLKVGDMPVDTTGTITIYNSGVLPAGAYVARLTFKMKNFATKPQCGDEAALGYISARLTTSGTPKIFNNFNIWAAVTPAC